MKKSIVLTLTDEELIELERTILDDDSEGALRFLKKHIGDKARGTLENRGHCKPWFEVFGQSPIPSELRKNLQITALNKATNNGKEVCDSY